MNIRKSDKKRDRRRIVIPEGVVTALSVLAAMAACLWQARLTSVYGEAGGSFHAAAFCWFFLPGALLSAGLCESVSSMVVNRLERGRGKEAGRIVRTALPAGLLLCLIFAALLFAAAGLLTDLENVPLSAMTLRVMAPALLFLMILSVLTGGLDGFGCQSAAGAVRLLFCISLFVSSTLFARPFLEYGQKVGALLQNSLYGPAYGAVGGAVSLVFSSAFGMLAAFVYWILKRPQIREQMQAAGAAQPESALFLMRGVLSGTLPVFLPLAFLGAADLIQTLLYFRLSGEEGQVSAAVLQEWGAYAGKSRALFLAPALLVFLFAGYAMPGMKVSYLQRNARRIRERCMISLRCMLLLAMPFCVGMMVLARPFLEVFFPNGDNAPAMGLIRLESIGLLCFALAAVLCAVMMSMELTGMLAAGMAVSLAVGTAVLYVLLSPLKMGVYGVIYGNIILLLLLSALLWLCISRQARMRINWIRIVLAPLVGGLVMAGICALFGLVLLQNAPALLCASVSALLGFAAYCAVVLLLKGATPRELEAYPGGELLIELARRLRLL